MKKTYKKILGIMMAAVLALSLGITSLAVDDTAEAEENIAEPQAVRESIVRTLDSCGDYVLFHEATNWYNDNKVTVMWVPQNYDPEPKNINVRIYEQMGGTGFKYYDDFDLTEGAENTFTLPYGGKFQIKAGAWNGYGKVRLLITSSK